MWFAFENEKDGGVLLHGVSTDKAELRARVLKNIVRSVLDEIITEDERERAALLRAAGPQTGLSTAERGILGDLVLNEVMGPHRLQKFYKEVNARAERVTYKEESDGRVRNRKARSDSRG